VSGFVTPASILIGRGFDIVLRVLAGETIVPLGVGMRSEVEEA
jgi:hypothetical protein